MTEYALIRAGTVVNVIVADETFAALIKADWDAVVRVDGRPDRPGPGWAYRNDTFSPQDQQSPGHSTGSSTVA